MNRKIALSVFLFTFLLSLQTSYGKSTSLENEIQGLLKQLRLNPDKAGISIRNVEDGKEVVSLNGNKLFNPASNIKILTSYCALKKLGINYKWTTKIFADGSVENGVLKGNLYIKGNGDPYMVSENLWMLVKELKNLGLKKISGDIYVDTSEFSKSKTAKSFKSDYDRSFTAFTSPISLNFNSVTINVHPREPGEKPYVVVDPDIPYFEIINKAKSVSSQRHANPKLSISPHGNKTKIVLFGNWAKNSKRKHYRKVFHPELYFAHTFIKFYRDLGGEVIGKIKRGSVPEKAQVILDFKSRPLSRNVYGLNKFSNNFMADQIAITLGREILNDPSFKSGIKVINECFKDIVSNKLNGNFIHSASGLSRETRITASQLTEILSKVQKDFQISSEFVTSLGVYGDDGTLKRRDFPSDLNGRVRAKTGNLDGVDALSGYIEAKSGKLYSFSIIANGFKFSKKHNYRKLQDKVINIVFNSK